MRRFRAISVNDYRNLKLIRRLFSAPSAPPSPSDTIVWWERRRLAYNALIGTAAIACFLIYCLSIASTGVLQPGEDIVEPIALLAAPLVVILINVCYTLGWLIDAPLRVFFPSLSSRFTSRLFLLGLGFSLIVVSFPAVYWSSYRVLQLVHVIQ
jgi:hypothetical protein